ncbi:MAG: sulfatase-like hydrolase/transferase [Verrucomicrobiota bacterium]|nr:sulfatase-like hydrolase/transferase [Verrucomicrobiota bacterium]
MNRLFILLFIAVAALARPLAEERPNFILCMADDQGWGDTGYNGHPLLKTPVMDEMARTGLRFDRFYAAAAVCSPTRGSVMTGRHPNRFGCFAWGHTLRPQEITIAEALKKAGYTTGHFGKWHIGSVRADGTASPGNSGFDEWFSSPNFYENNPLFSHNGKVIETKGESSDVTAGLAMDWIGKVAKGKKPFLAVVWFGNPHSPHVAVDKFKKMYSDQPDGVAHFFGEITAMDAALGKMRSGLRKLGIADNTVLWYCSDNGSLPKGSSGGLRARKGSLYEGGIRVPAVLEWPARVKANRITDINANTSDIYPTLLELAGVALPKNQPRLDGISLAPLLRGQKQVRKQPMGFWTYHNRGYGRHARRMLEALRQEQLDGNQKPAAPEGQIGHFHPADNLPGHSAWIEGDYKLHRIPMKKNATQFNYELYHLVNDPKESNNLLNEDKSRLAKRFGRMKADLVTWQQSVINSLNGRDYR